MVDGENDPAFLPFTADLSPILARLGKTVMEGTRLQETERALVFLAFERCALFIDDSMKSVEWALPGKNLFVDTLDALDNIDQAFMVRILLINRYPDSLKEWRRFQIDDFRQLHADLKEMRQEFTSSPDRESAARVAVKLLAMCVSLATRRPSFHSQAELIWVLYPSQGDAGGSGLRTTLTP